MGNIYNAYEVFEIAGQIERNGKRFYEKAATAVKNENAKSLMLSLADIEALHEETFKTLMEELSLKGDIEFPDSENQTLLYLNSMAEGKIFGNLEDDDFLIKSESSYIELIERAIDIEKNSVIFYATIKDIVPKELGKDKIDVIIREEVSHIAALIAEKNKNY